MRRGLFVLALLGLGARPGEAHKPTVTKFTYHRDVYPIFRDKCGGCHQTGGVGPMSLLSYQEAYPWAIAIKTEVLDLAMPPWFADERYGRFQHAAPLTASEVNTIVDWCLGGAPEGDPFEPQAPIETSAGSQRTPDLVLELPAPHLMGPDVMESFHEARLSTGLERERFLRALEIRPESRSVLRSALVFVVPEGSEVKPSHLAFSWIAGEEVLVWPPERAFRLPARSSLVLRLHYRKTWLDEGKEISDRSGVGLYFREDSGAAAVETLVLTSGGALVSSGENGFEETVSHEVKEPVEVLALLPRVENPVEWLRAEASTPDGGLVPLIRLRAPDPRWPRTFWLEEPLSLPAGSEIRLTVAAAGGAPPPAPHRLFVSVVRE